MCEKFNVPTNFFFCRSYGTVFLDYLVFGRLFFRSTSILIFFCCVLHIFVQFLFIVWLFSIVLILGI